MTDHVDHVFKVNERVVDSYDLDFAVLNSVSEDDTTDTAKTV